MPTAEMGPCPKCGSSDANATYPDHTWCYTCKTYTPGDKMQTPNTVVPMKKINNSDYVWSDIPDRKITLDTCKKYGVMVARQNQTITEHKYPYYDEKGNNLANKYRKTQTP